MIDFFKIQKRIFDLYAEKEYIDSEIKTILEKYKDRVKIWEDGLQQYTTEDVLKAIDEYWRFKNSDIKPRLAHIQAMLNTQKQDEVFIDCKSEDREKLARAAEITKKRLEQETINKWGI